MKKISKKYIISESQLSIDSDCKVEYEKKISKIYSDDEDKFLNSLEKTFPKNHISTFKNKIVKIFRDNLSKKNRVLLVSLLLIANLGCTKPKEREYLQPGCGTIVWESIKQVGAYQWYYYLIYMKTGPDAGKQGWISVGLDTYLNYHKGDQYCFRTPQELRFR